MFETFSLRISVECHGCRISIPRNGVIADTRCYHCGEVNGRAFGHALIGFAHDP